MDSSLHEVWQAAAGSPFVPAIGKGSQFWVAFILLVLGFSLSGAFALSMSIHLNRVCFPLTKLEQTDHFSTSPSSPSQRRWLSRTSIHSVT